MSDFKSEFIIKNTIFFVIFVALAIFLITKLLVPKIDTYKKQLGENRKTQLVLSQAKKDFSSISGSVQAFLGHDEELFNKLYAPILNEDDIGELFKKYFLSLKIARLGENRENDLLFVSYNIKGYVRDHLALQDFMQNVSFLPFIIHLQVPLELSYDNASQTTKVDMNFEIIKSVYDAHELVKENNLEFKIKRN